MDVRSVSLKVGAALYFAPSWSLGLAVERSTDFLDTDDPNTLANELDAAYWVGGFGNYSFHDRIEFSLFAGIRRGGTACTAGTCYLVLPFEGAEFRITTHL